MASCLRLTSSRHGLPEIISEETFMDLLMMSDDPMPTDIDDESYENEDLDDDGLMIG
jgi:hypothetical protein